MGTLEGFAPPFGPPPATNHPLASLGLAKPFGPPPATSSPLASLGRARWYAAGEGARCARGGQGGLSVPKAGGLPTRLFARQKAHQRGPRQLSQEEVGQGTGRQEWTKRDFRPAN